MIRARLRNVGVTLKETEEAFDLEVADSALTLQERAFALIVQATPVDTGRAVGSWGMNTIGLKSDRDITGPASKTPIPRSVYKGVAYTTNGTNYIQELNQGTSPQASAFFVEEANLRIGLKGKIDSDSGGHN